MIFININLTVEEIDYTRRGGLISRDWDDVVFNSFDLLTRNGYFMQLGDKSSQGFTFAQAELTPHGFDIGVRWNG